MPPSQADRKNDASAPAVLRLESMGRQQRADLEALLARYGLSLTPVEAATPIPGSYWGDEEAGLSGRQLLARDDTPLHSLLHEACHFICMDEKRRDGLDTDAGGDFEEENAVCYLQILLAGQLAGFSTNQMCEDMDRWGYSFRLGSARAWFEKDAQDARQFLLRHQIINRDETPTWKRRSE